MFFIKLILNQRFIPKIYDLHINLKKKIYFGNSTVWSACVFIF